MKLENLKVGDRIKYRKQPQNPHLENCEIKEGIITRIHQELTKYIIFENGFWCYPENVISYLEPIIGGPWEQYMEIKIEQDKIPETHWRCSNPPKNSIKLSELKIGDKIKFQLPHCIPVQGTINKIYSDSFIVDGNHVSEKYVTSKIEKIDTPPFPIEWRETPIEKEYPTLKCNNCGQFYFEKAFCGDVCFKCIEKNKEKPAPKSFKFDVSGELLYYGQITLFPAVDKTKKYTVEIKEKE